MSDGRGKDKSKEDIEAQGCTNPFVEDEPAPKEYFSGTLPGGFVVVNGRICEAPDCWPLNILPSYKSACAKCGEDCTCEEPNCGGGETYTAGPGISILNEVISIDLSTLTDIQKEQLCAIIQNCDGGGTCTDTPIAPSEQSITVIEGVAGSQVISGCVDPCGDGVSLSVAGLPSGVLFDDVSNTLSWDGTAAIGTYQITVTCTNANGSDDWVLNYIVDEDDGGNTNLPPVLNAPSDITITEGESYNQNFGAVCSDPENDIVTITVSGLPPGMSWSQIANGGFSIFGTPTVSGTYEVTVSCTDGTNPPVTDTFNINISDNPLIAPVNCPFTVTANEGDPIGLDIFGPFTGGTQPISVTATGLPSGVSLLNFGNGTWALTGTAPPASGSPYTYDVTATDANGQTSECLGNQILVGNAVPICPTSAQVINCQAMPSIGSVPNATSVTFTPALVDYNHTFNPTTGALTIDANTPGVGGTETVTVTASNGDPLFDCSFTLVINGCDADCAGNLNCTGDTVTEGTETWSGTGSIPNSVPAVALGACSGNISGVIFDLAIDHATDNIVVTVTSGTIPATWDSIDLSQAFPPLSASIDLTSVGAISGTYIVNASATGTSAADWIDLLGDGAFTVSATCA